MLLSSPLSPPPRRCLLQRLSHPPIILQIRIGIQISPIVVITRSREHGTGAGNMGRGMDMGMDMDMDMDMGMGMGMGMGMARGWTHHMTRAKQHGRLHAWPITCTTSMPYYSTCHSPLIHGRIIRIITRHGNSTCMWSRSMHRCHNLIVTCGDQLLIMRWVWD